MNVTHLARLVIHWIIVGLKKNVYKKRKKNLQQQQQQNKQKNDLEGVWLKWERTTVSI